jgi:hypothetical protein
VKVEVPVEVQLIVTVQIEVAGEELTEEEVELYQ